MREISSSSCRCDGSSTIATVDEIQRRLHRPIPPPPSSRPSFSTDIKLHDSIEKERDSEKKKLEDYLDPILLSAISSKMKGNRRNGEKKRKRDAEFEWPTEELRVFLKTREVSGLTEPLALTTIWRRLLKKTEEAVLRFDGSRKRC